MSQTPEQQNQAQGRICGVFSQKKMAKIGTGTTARRTELMSYFLVREREDGMLEVQALTASDLPFGPVSEITREELLENYLPEPQKTMARAVASLSPQEQEIQKSVARGDKFRKRGESFTAEFEYSKALALDTSNVRANFGLGLTYVERGETVKAQDILGRIVGLEAAFAPEHKHLFNEFGINLRKAKMHDEALDYYRRALELSPADENLHYNMARAAFDKGDSKTAAKELMACLKLNPEHEEARQFIDYIKRKQASGS